jgi:hypothetical protein
MIAEEARSKDKSWKMVRTSGRGRHEKWRLGATVQVSVPRHREVNDITAQAILKATEPELGEEWWT